MRHALLLVFRVPVYPASVGLRVASSKICCADIYLAPPVFLAVYSASRRPGTSVRLIHRYMETSARGKMGMHFYDDANLDFLLD